MAATVGATYPVWQLRSADCVEALLTPYGRGAMDAVGATMRKQVVLLSTPDHLRGRAQSGHQMAAVTKLRTKLRTNLTPSETI